MAPEVVLAFTGDVMLGRGVNEIVRADGPAFPWGDTIDLLRGADLRFINLECVISAAGRPWARTPKTFFFRADPIAIGTLKLADIDFVALANNHSLDFEVEALVEMLDRLDGAGIARAGAGRDESEAARAALIKTRETKIAAISITDNEPGWAAGRGRPGTNYFPISLKPGNLKRLRAQIREARRVADLVILSAHWGPNMVDEPSPVFQRFARAAVDAGADIFHGHSAHIFQGIEVYREKLIMYDTGDFIDDYVVDPILRNDLSFLFLVTVEAGRLAKVDLVPVQIADYQVNKAVGEAAATAISRMDRLCRRMDTETERRGERLAVDLRSSSKDIAN